MTRVVPIVRIVQVIRILQVVQVIRTEQVVQVKRVMQVEQVVRAGLLDGLDGLVTGPGGRARSRTRLPESATVNPARVHGRRSGAVPPDRQVW